MQDIIDLTCCNKDTTENSTITRANTSTDIDKDTTIMQGKLYYVDEEAPGALLASESALPPMPVPVPVPTSYQADIDIREEQRQTGIARIQLSFELDALTNTRARLFYKVTDKTCPYVLVTSLSDEDGAEGEPKKIGKTETSWNKLRTRFCEPIYVNHSIDTSSPYVNVCVYDNLSQDKIERTLDEAGEDSSDTLLCEHLLDLGSMKEEIEKESYSLREMLFVDKGTETLRKEEKDLYQNPSFFKICGHYSSECSERFEIHFRALGVKNVEKGTFNLSRTDPFFVICKKHVGIVSDEVHWQAVYKSKHIADHLNPLWEPGTVNLEQLCDGKLDKRLQVEIWDYEASGFNQIVGKLNSELTLKELMRKKALRGNADRTNGLDMEEVLDDKEVNPNPAGVLIVLKADPCDTH